MFRHDWLGKPERARAELTALRQALDVYQDTGCPEWGIPSCLSCWLPACRFDLPPKQAGALVRMMQVRALSREGLTRTEIGQRMGLSARTVSRLRVGLRTWGALLPEAQT